ncbi:transglutaminase-like cysteine peptidase [Motilimonas pumila]|uniref:Sulfate adenylyltransferase n=1 Tax=Motilimonas pumila TaxID=2303987 RepID=A0A418YBC9_9GAMM|nr:transglutaminase-like cysteine peptidase [Motilimonas pumila]RJG40307.1 sulfate adenylyltransferase [Motilimonas pumila]
MPNSIKMIVSLVLACTSLNTQASELEQYFNTQQVRSDIQSTYGEQAINRIDELIDTLNNSKELSDKAKLAQVNDFFNSLIFTSDQKLWGKEDYWASPVEFVGAKGGDCEDYAIAKYYSLMELGFAEKQLRLVYVKAVEFDQFHMVLAFYPSRRANPLILDNIKTDIIAASRRKDLLPVYSFNAQHLWLMGKAKSGEPVGDAERLAEWKSVRTRFASSELKSPRRAL